MNYYYPQYYQPPYPPVPIAQPYYYVPYPPLIRTYPPVDPAIFMKSASEMQAIMKDASILLAKMASSKKFSFDLMTAAQASKNAQVDSMIKSTGIKNPPKISYTPTGLTLNFEGKEPGMNCCQLSLLIRWS